ncbi:unnamed protein product [Clavelina lepadiformis]|uniref:thiopurine S-methyltransferase n=1 Tax=Clavelina lepadiformis TaxID=159417 RepID=A0ABP0F7N9_CLALP
MEKKTTFRDLSEEEKKNYWHKRWQNRDFTFHLPEAHPDMVKHKDKFLKPKCRVFLPFCGKAVDLKYLADDGHDVVGCEVSNSAVLQFFEEQSIKFERSQHATAPYEIFKAIDEKITIYKGDFFALDSSIIGKFDAVWDRGAFVATDPSRRQEYIDVIYGFLNTGGKYLLQTFQYEGNVSATPFSTSPLEFGDIFGQKFNFSILQTYEDTELSFVKKYNLPVASVTVTLLQPRI